MDSFFSHTHTHTDAHVCCTKCDWNKRIKASPELWKVLVSHVCFLLFHFDLCSFKIFYFYLVRVYFLFFFSYSDVIDLSEDKTLSSKSTDEKEGSDTCGVHTNDALNQPDAQGRVLVNPNHPASEKDIFLLPQLARVVKPHQVIYLRQCKMLLFPPFSPPCCSLLHQSALPPQIGGIRFLYNNLVESVERFGSSSGFGCILAHSMGLGKTLQVISFIDVLFRHTQAHTVLAIVPVSTCGLTVRI